MAIGDLLKSLGQGIDRGFTKIGGYDPSQQVSQEEAFRRKNIGIENLQRTLGRSAAIMSGDPQRLALSAQQDKAAKQERLLQELGKDPRYAEQIKLLKAGLDPSAFAPKVSKGPSSYEEYIRTDSTPTEAEYLAFLERQKKAGASTTTVQLPKEEEEYIKSLAKLGQTDITESRKIATTSRELIPRLQTAQILLQNPDFVTGPLTEKFLPLKKLYNDLTGQDQTEVSGQELFQALANYTVPRMRPPGSGATSDFEANLFSTATIGLGKSKESNELLVATMIQQAKREQKLLKEKENYYLKNKGNTVGFEQYLEENNLVPPLYQQINLQSQDIGEFYDKGLIRNGEAYIDMTDPNFPKLTVFRIADFD
ncbi:hypothetical protein N9F71_01050 [bacterium]|nr:hypothetical protein [bacterium]